MSSTKKPRFEIVHFENSSATSSGNTQSNSKKSKGKSSKEPERFEMAKTRKEVLFSAQGFCILAGAFFIMVAVTDLYSSLQWKDSRVNREDRISALVGQEMLLPSGEFSRPNPNVPWYELYFCRGRMKSSLCSGKAYHPYLEWWDNHSQDPTVPPGAKHQAMREIQDTFLDRNPE